MAEQQEEFERVMREGGIEDQQVLVFILDETVRGNFPEHGCVQCLTERQDGERIYVWPEGQGSLAALHVHCSRECAERSIYTHLTDARGLEDADVYTTYFNMNFRED